MVARKGEGKGEGAFWLQSLYLNGVVMLVGWVDGLSKSQWLWEMQSLAQCTHAALKCAMWVCARGRRYSDYVCFLMLAHRLDGVFSL